MMLFLGWLSLSMFIRNVMWITIVVMTFLGAVSGISLLILIVNIILASLSVLILPRVVISAYMSWVVTTVFSSVVFSVRAVITAIIVIARAHIWIFFTSMVAELLQSIFSIFISRARPQNLSIILVRVTSLLIWRLMTIWWFTIIYNSVGCLIISIVISLSMSTIESRLSLILKLVRILWNKLSDLASRFLLTSRCKMVRVKKSLFCWILEVLIRSLLVVRFRLLSIIWMVMWVEFLFFGLPKKCLVKLFVGNFHITQVRILALNSCCSLPEYTFNFPDSFIWSR